MPAMEGRPSPHRWNQIKKLPLQPGIRTLQEYEEEVSTGILDALNFFRVNATSEFPFKTLRHRTRADACQLWPQEAFKWKPGFH